MPDFNKDWVTKQLAKIIGLEESILRTEKDHRDKLDLPDIKSIYNSMIDDDQRHLDELKRLAGRYGYDAGRGMGSVGEMMGGLKSAVESVATHDPFQTIADDLTLKSAALNSDRVWTQIFGALGDSDSAAVMDRAMNEDQGHEDALRQALINIGVREARTGVIHEKAA